MIARWTQWTDVCVAFLDHSILILFGRTMQFLWLSRKLVRVYIEVEQSDERLHQVDFLYRVVVSSMISNPLRSSKARLIPQPVGKISSK